VTSYWAILPNQTKPDHDSKNLHSSHTPASFVHSVQEKRTRSWHGTLSLGARRTGTACGDESMRWEADVYPAVRSKRKGGVAQQTGTGPSCVRPANSTRFLDLRLKRVLGQLLNPCTVQRPAMRTCCRTVRRFRLVKVPTSTMYACLFGRCC
jgi:hypothetical protein